MFTQLRRKAPAGSANRFPGTKSGKALFSNTVFVMTVSPDTGAAMFAMNIAEKTPFLKTLAVINTAAYVLINCKRIWMADAFWRKSAGKLCRKNC